MDAIDKSILVYERLTAENPVIAIGRLCYRFNDLIKEKYVTPKTFPLPRSVFLEKDKYIEDIKILGRLCEITRSYTNYSSEFIELTIDQTKDEVIFPLPFMLPLSSTGKRKIKIPTDERFMCIIHQGVKYILLHPGFILCDNDEYLYQSISLDLAITKLEERNNYDIGMPILSLDEDETPESLKQKLILYMRMRIKRAFHSGDDPVLLELYQASQDYSLSQVVANIRSRKLGKKEIRLFHEFPLLYSTIKGKILLYVDEDCIDVYEARELLKMDDENVTAIPHPMIGSLESKDKYNYPIEVDIRTLHLNYTYRITDDKYEDFLGEAEFIIAPVTILNQEEAFEGCITHPIQTFLEYYLKRSK